MTDIYQVIQMITITLDTVIVQPTDVTAANFNASNIIRDNECLVPLNDWVPLMNFTMDYPADDPSPRYLANMRLVVGGDPRSAEDLGYSNAGGPEVSDLLEFGLFRETWDTDEEDNLILDVGHDFLLHRWTAAGSGPATLVNNFPLVYDLDFIGLGSTLQPTYPVPAGPDGDETFPGYSYIIAVRTSATWREQLTLNVDLLSAEMVVPGQEGIPRNEDGEPTDGYTPNFFEGETIDAETSYASSFTVFDITEFPGNPADTPFVYQNLWLRHSFPYVPLAEHIRPRWSALDQVIDAVASEVVQLRELIALDDWSAPVGINVHSTLGLHFPDSLSYGTHSYNEDFTQMQEVNVILTDIGADPYGNPGNGGFDPRTGLESFQYALSGNDNLAEFPDLAFNGVSIWHDTNGNGKFDPPILNATRGISFGGDLPMIPYTSAGGEFEYIPFPPGGGDPWWKTSLRLYDGNRRFDFDDTMSGAIEPQMDNITGLIGGAAVTFDYFVVVRTNSGYRDISINSNPGPGINVGADFRTFIEPRRTDANTGLSTGGIYLDSMIPPLALSVDNNRIFSLWQSDSRWGADEPWWPHRTHNQNTAKPVRVGVEVHDLIMLYQSKSEYSQVSDLFFGAFFSGSSVYGFATGTGLPSDFDRWMDPFGLVQAQFLNAHTVSVINGQATFNSTSTYVAGNETATFDFNFVPKGTFDLYAFETVPFFNTTLAYNDAPPIGPRSGAFQNPPAQPALPDYETWPRPTSSAVYPHMTQWAQEDARARLLTQKSDTNGDRVAILGFNLIGTPDPVVNANLNGNAIQLAEINVAFWGPDFSPSDLQALDDRGLDGDSGVQLWEDTDENGVFFDLPVIGALFDQAVEGLLAPLDEAVPLTNLRWGNAPEPIDLDGDGTADDMDGDGLVDERDYGWVLTLVPEDLWEVPQNDDYTNTFTFDYGMSTVWFTTGGSGGGTGATNSGNMAASAILGNGPGKQNGTKALDPTLDHPGDDLFLTVRLSDQAQRFEKFRAVVPATLPGRGENARRAGIQFFPEVNSSPSAFTKTNPEEAAVQDFYSHDTVEVNVPMKIVNLANANQVITAGGSPMAVLGLDISTNKPENTLATGQYGTGNNGLFTVDSQIWEVGAFAGDWLVDSAFETYEILSNGLDKLTLRSGTPRNGEWRIVRDPSFLEQVIVELYNTGTDANFNPLQDLLPLSIDQRISGVALYRDNDAHGDNTNGQFDPGIDIPLVLDAAPRYGGASTSDLQVKFVFSSPGTDNIPVPLEDQARNRQWTFNTFASRMDQDAFGVDFFIVVRASQDMAPGDDFRMGIVNWGPNTPTEPDPDTWATLVNQDGSPSSARGDYTKYQEFPWGSRGIGFVSFFKEPPLSYSLFKNTALQKPDSSGFNWIRSHSSKKRRTSTIEARDRIIGPNTIVIDSVSEPILPEQTPPEGFSLIIYGRNFTNNPRVTIDGYKILQRESIVNFNQTEISVTIHSIDGIVPQAPVTLMIEAGRDQTTTRTDLFSLVPPVSLETPVIDRVRPRVARAADFPVVIEGSQFADRDNIAVRFGSTILPVSNVNAEGTRITVQFPNGGIARVGVMDVAVINNPESVEKMRETVLLDAFDYVNKIGILGCSAGESGQDDPFGDLLVILLALTALLASRIKLGKMNS
jgi:hypothetical protein